jgi:hypothetical protein
MRWCLANVCTLVFFSSLVASGLAGDNKVSVEPGPLSIERIRQAVSLAGFQVRDQKVEIPTAVRPRLRFFAPNYDDPTLAALRQKYSLNQVVAGGRDEWQSQLLLKEWVHKRIPEGVPEVSYNNALDILEHAASGQKFWCTHYAITYAECAAAVGWPVRKIGVDRRHGPKGMGSNHHGVAEVWSNQFGKWLVIDPQSNLHFEKSGIPLSAWEIRAEWLKDGGRSVDHVVGVPPSAVKNSSAMAWHRTEDETAIYFWFYLEDRVLANQAAANEQPRLIFPQDAANRDLIWYQNGDPESKGGELHRGYLQNTFLSTSRLEDVYWTVGVSEVTILGVSKQSLQLGLDSYCPNRTGYEFSVDGVHWQPVKNEKQVEWSLKPNWNSLRVRTTSRGNVTGPETSILLLLEPLENH